MELQVTVGQLGKHSMALKI